MVAADPLVQGAVPEPLNETWRVAAKADELSIMCAGAAAFVFIVWTPFAWAILPLVIFPDVDFVEDGREDVVGGTNELNAGLRIGHIEWNRFKSVEEVGDAVLRVGQYHFNDAGGPAHGVGIGADRRHIVPVHIIRCGPHWTDGSK